MTDRQVPGILLLLLAMLALTGVALVALWVAVFDVRALALVVAFAGYFLAVHVYLPYRVYVDARARGSAAAAAWAAVAFLLPLLGAAIYLLAARAVADRAA